MLEQEHLSVLLEKCRKEDHMTKRDFCKSLGLSLNAYQNFVGKVFPPRVVASVTWKKVKRYLKKEGFLDGK